MSSPTGRLSKREPSIQNIPIRTPEGAEIRKAFTMINEFSGEHFFLSNMYPCKIEYEGLVYNSVEHAYQAAKSVDLIVREQIRSVASPKVAKRLSRSIELREGWDHIKISIMDELVRIKFKDPYLRRKLEATWPHELVEGNWWGDTFWGVCRGVGKNHLGKILMLIRSEFVGMVK